MGQEGGGGVHMLNMCVCVRERENEREREGERERGGEKVRVFVDNVLYVYEVVNDDNRYPHTSTSIG